MVMWRKGSGHHLKKAPNREREREREIPARSYIVQGGDGVQG